MAVREVAVTARTDAGMWLLWQPQAFASVHDYDSWSMELEDDADVSRHVGQGHCCPINIGSDMAAAFVIRAGDASEAAVLTERELAYRVVSSDPYLVVSQGLVAISGIEDVGVETAAELALSPGPWAATVHLIAWDDEPGMKVDGKPVPTALPDFVVLLNPADPGQPFRSDLITFTRP